MESYIVLNLEGFELNGDPLAKELHLTCNEEFSDYIIKEVAYITSDHAQGVIYVEPPVPWSELSYSAKQNVSSVHLPLANITHGFAWNEGHLPYEQLKPFLVALTAGYKTIYCPHYWKMNVLYRLLARPIYFNFLSKKEEEEEAYHHHPIPMHSEYSSFCTKHLGRTKYCAFQEALFYFYRLQEYKRETVSFILHQSNDEKSNDLPSTEKLM